MFLQNQSWRIRLLVTCAVRFPLMHMEFPQDVWKCCGFWGHGLIKRSFIHRLLRHWATQLCYLKHSNTSVTTTILFLFQIYTPMNNMSLFVRSSDLFFLFYQHSVVTYLCLNRHVSLSLFLSFSAFCHFLLLISQHDSQTNQNWGTQCGVARQWSPHICSNPQVLSVHMSQTCSFFYFLDCLIFFFFFN